jgi:caffeoyl-CoA O-methyltransferase
MKKFIDPKVEAYAQAHCSAEKPIYKTLAAVTQRKTKWPQMQVGHLEGQFLKLMVQVVRAKTVLEIGCFTGYSALAMAEALPANGTLTTLDIDPINTLIGRNVWEKHPAGRKIHLIIGAALESLKKLSGPFDVVFIDADKSNYIHYWNAVLPKVRQGGLILIDNVLWSGEVLKPTDENGRALAAFNK